MGASFIRVGSCGWIEGAAVGRRLLQGRGPLPAHLPRLHRQLDSLLRLRHRGPLPTYVEIALAGGLGLRGKTRAHIISARIARDRGVGELLGRLTRRAGRLTMGRHAMQAQKAEGTKDLIG